VFIISIHGPKPKYVIFYLIRNYGSQKMEKNIIYSKKQIRRAGDALAKDIIWDSNLTDEIYPVFQLANHWIASHAYPMNRLRHELIGKIRKCGADGITVGRLKSMRSIRRKLRVKPEGLHQIQDLGGCRSIVASIAQASDLVEEQLSNSRHRFIYQNNYIQKPKIDGYRSHHLIFEFQGSENDDDVFDGKRIELQVRTRLQHSWATAVEAVGLFRNENLKASEGSSDWLRLFQLMSAEFSYTENSPEPEGSPPRSERVLEIIDLEKKLNAASILDGIRDAVRYTEIYTSDPKAKPTHYLVTYDHIKRQVKVKPYLKPMNDAYHLGVAELKSESDVSDNMTSIVVEADKVENLKDAFPNYFGDVSIFGTNLKLITSGDSAKEYLMPPQQVVVTPAEAKIDPRWLRPGRHRKWE